MSRILKFSRQCYYCEELMGVVVFTKVRGFSNLESPQTIRVLELSKFTCPWTFAKSTTPIKFSQQCTNVPIIFNFRNSSWETTRKIQTHPKDGKVLSVNNSKNNPNNSNNPNPSSSFTPAIAILTVSDDNLQEVPEHPRGANKHTTGGANKSPG